MMSNQMQKKQIALCFQKTKRNGEAGNSFTLAKITPEWLWTLINKFKIAKNALKMLMI